MFIQWTLTCYSLAFVKKKVILKFFKGFLKVGISSSEAHPFKKTENKSEEVTLHKTLHVPPSMTAQNLCDMIAKKFNVSAPQVRTVLHAFSIIPVSINGISQVTI